MLKIRYAKNTYAPKCQNTHGPKLWLLDTWAWAHGPGRMGRRRPAAAAGPPPPGKVRYQGGGAAMGPGPGPWARPWAQAMGPCPCVQEPKLWPMSIFTFGPISIFSIPDV